MRAFLEKDCADTVVHSCVHGRGGSTRRGYDGELAGSLQGVTGVGVEVGLGCSGERGAGAGRCACVKSLTTPWCENATDSSGFAAAGAPPANTASTRIAAAFPAARMDRAMGGRQLR